ncbi:hypothetical protein L6452_08680 [Arctium lappa]|uniref:Uncharacterized protein n=1 Tax=Arctium lappa TaxID=4217 RepID=A0ACB9DID4_ARCLA|nr:hypothetical protein L6452_08680 [Arctium lappa]
MGIHLRLFTTHEQARRSSMSKLQPFLWFRSKIKFLGLLLEASSGIDGRKKPPGDVMSQERFLQYGGLASVEKLMCSHIGETERDQESPANGRVPKLVSSGVETVSGDGDGDGDAGDRVAMIPFKAERQGFWRG